MSPGNLNNSNLMNTDKNLNQKAIDSLLPKFEAHRKSPRYPHCEKITFFRPNGPTKADPPRPIFRCHGCGKTYRFHTMAYIIQSSLSPSHVVNSMTCKASKVLHDIQLSLNSRTTNQPNNLLPLLGMIQCLTTKLASARAEMNSLCQQTAKPQ